MAFGEGTPTPSVDGQSSAEAEEKIPSSATTRPSYVAQYSKSTQMILDRIKASQANIASASRSSESAARPSSYAASQAGRNRAASVEEARKRLLQSIKPSSMMALPAQPSARSTTPLSFVPQTLQSRPFSSTPGPRPRALNASSPAGNTLPLPTPAYSMSQPPPEPLNLRPLVLGPQRASKVLKPVIKPVSRASRKSSAKDTASDLSQSSDEETTQLRTQTTKSGRQVQKPAQFIPHQNTKKKNMAKRTEAQAMCKLCNRLSGTDDNEIVFCDSCNVPWHQKCVFPMIPNQLVNSGIPWFCPKCQMVKKDYIGPNDGLVSWAHRAHAEKLAYLETIPQPTLVSLLMKALEYHPDLPIFSETQNVEVAEPARGADASPSRPKLASGGPASFIKRHGKNAMNREVEVDLNLMPELEPHLKWPKHGGLYAELPPEKDDPFLEDEDDYEAFSEIRYDKDGNKIWENGKPVEPEQKTRARS